ncbi:siroheme synthase CysG [Aliikangiella sp. IMCC44653]
MDYLPITVQMQNRQCLIVGGGEVAARKLKHLLKAGSQITIVSPKFSPQLEAAAVNTSTKLIKAKFNESHLSNQYLVIAATDDEQLNTRISTAAKERNIWVNVVDNLALCSFIMPAVIDRSPLLIAVSSSGVSPVLARKIREKIEVLLPKNLGSLLLRLRELRPWIKKNLSNFGVRRAFSEWYIETAISNSNVLALNSKKLLQRYKTELKHPLGKIYLIGAGPGDAELLTVKALKVLQKADVVLYDALVSQDILDCVRKDATLIHVGKRSNLHFVTQDKTNQLLVEQAELGLSVVRLKGGDPFIFGRGGEELQHLSDHQIEFEVIPGITAASGCASYAGIPLTHRDYSQSLHLVTAHEKGSQSRVDWRAMAQANQTLVFYMGLLSNQTISQKLIAYGLSQSTPVAVVENGTLVNQRVLLTRLDYLAAAVVKHQISTPALIIVGEVTRLAKSLNWNSQSVLINELENDAFNQVESLFKEAL